eukprot:4171665-Pyramimonas_sp.AAC.1
MFYIDSKACVLEDLARRAQKKGLYINPGAVTAKFNFEDVLSKHETERLLAFQSDMAKKQTSNDDYMFDLEQWPSYTSCGPYLPAVTRNVTLWSQKHRRPSTVRENLLSLGMPAIDGGPLVDGYLKCPFAKMLKDMPVAEAGGLVGNGIAMPVVGAMFLYVLSNLMR